MSRSDYISVAHGSMTLEIPAKLFKGNDCQVDWEAAKPFMDVTRSRYPWISENAFKEIMRKARLEMMRVRDEETNGREYSRLLTQKGKTQDAIAHMELRLNLNPDDPNGWYELGELYFKSGQMDKGYEAFRKGDTLRKRRRAASGL